MPILKNSDAGVPQGMRRDENGRIVPIIGAMGPKRSGGDIVETANVWNRANAQKGNAPQSTESPAIVPRNLPGRRAARIEKMANPDSDD